MKGFRPEPACRIDSEGTPTCATGPLGRFTWTLRQLAEMLHLVRAR